VSVGVVAHVQRDSRLALGSQDPLDISHAKDGAALVSSLATESAHIDPNYSAILAPPQQETETRARTKRVEPPANRKRVATSPVNESQEHVTTLVGSTSLPKSIKSAKSIVPVNPKEPAKPLKPANPTKSAKPTKSARPPDGPTKSAKPIMPAAPTKLARPSKPTNPTGATVPAVTLRINENEKAVLRSLAATPAGLHLTNLARASFPKLDDEKANSWTRNSVRRPLKHGLVTKADKGTYRLTAAGKALIADH
jgi:hypothetical protein